MPSLSEIYTYIPASMWSLHPGRLVPIMLNPTEREYEIIMRHPTAYTESFNEHAVSGQITMNRETGQGDVYLWPTYANLPGHRGFLPTGSCHSFVVGFQIRRDAQKNQRLGWDNWGSFRERRGWICNLPFFKMLADKYGLRTW